MKIEFEAVKDIFFTYKVWVGGKEILWYRRAWERLDKEGLTEYNNYYEQCVVIIRVFTLLMIYQEFSQLMYNEICPYEFADWQEWSEISEFRVGQLIGSRHNDEFLEEGYDEFVSVDDAFMVLVEEERYIIFEALIKGNDVITVFNELYLSIVSIEQNEEECVINNYSTDEEIEEMYKKYKIQTKSFYIEGIEGESYNLQQAFVWILDGTYKL